MKNINYSQIKRIVSKINFLITIILIVFALVASNEIIHRKLDITVDSLNRCLNYTSLPCTNSVVAPFIPNQQLNDQQRFLSTIARKLPIVPQLDTFEYILLRTYGAAFINPDTEIKLPEKDIFVNEQETQ